MKKLLVYLFFSLNVLSCELPEAKSIVPYEFCHKDAILAFAMHDTSNLVAGSIAVEKGLMTQEALVAEGRKEMEKLLDDPSHLKKVLLINGIVAAFVEVSKEKEQSIESLMKLILAQGQVCTEQQLQAVLPMAKKRDAECEEFALIGSLIVAKEFRRKGYGRALLKDAIAMIKQRWPQFCQARSEYE